MKNKVLSGLVCFLVTLVTVVSIVPFKAKSQEYTVGEVQSLIDGIVGYKLNSAGAGSIQDWISGQLTDGAGSLSEWYIISLSQDGQTDFSSYESALTDYLAGNNVSSATSREKYALALSASGSRNSYISDILDSSIGEQGIMSYIYGLHVLNNGYNCSRFTSDDVVAQLLSMQYSDGGWALLGEYGDIDVTAMTMTALAPYYNSDSAVHEAVDRGVEFLSERQQDDGGYQSFGTANPESTSQVLTAISAIGIDGVHDERFIKNGNNVIDSIVSYRLSDGSYCHTHDGDSNETATVQALYSFIAYKRMCEGKSSLLVFDNRQQTEVSVQQTETLLQTTQEQAVRAENSHTEKKTTTEKSLSVTTSVSGVSSVKSTITSSITTVSKIASTTDNITETTLAVTLNSSSASVTTTAAVIKPEQNKKSNAKTKIIIIIVGTSVILSIILLALGKRSYKNFIFIIIAAGAASAIVLFTDIRSADEYYSGNSVVKDNSIGTVSLEIRCDTIIGKSDSEYIPQDGTILAATDFEIEEGDTVFDILTEAAQTYGIQVENKGSAGSAHGLVYISGINYIYEFDFGDLSGWVYHVNGVTPSRNCGEYILSDGDEIQWLYTCEIGHDLDEVYEDDKIF